ncbi:MAG: hypothetical protein RIR18_948, partial [Pseudomonadota bacterium]
MTQAGNMVEKPAEKSVIYLKDYQPPAWWIETVDLRFNIQADGTTVSAILAVRRNPEIPRQALVLDGDE